MPDLPAPVEAALAATNANDVDAFLDCFTRDGVVDDWGREFRGRDEIRAWSDREFNGPSHFKFQIEGDKVTRMAIRA
ncbi:MAG TPA: nuclear transport factor 2 family protein [Solirubrobacterales bacterium]